MKVLLFDIDGTIMLSGGAGMRAMDLAYEQIYGVKNVLKDVQLAGRTDTSIFIDALKKTGHSFSEHALEFYKKVYYEFLVKEMDSLNDGKYLMPGVQILLEALSKRPNVYLGLLTGNWQVSGRIKIGNYDLNKYFTFGAFADDSGVRNELVPFAVRRFTESTGLRPANNQVYVIGDTPADIQCARPHGAVAVAVAAAQYSVDQLREHNPDYLLPDLSDLDACLEILG